MARGQKKTYEDKVAELTLKIEQECDKKAKAIKAFDEKIHALNEEKKALIEEHNNELVTQLKEAIESSGLTVEEAIKKFKEQ